MVNIDEYKYKADRKHNFLMLKKLYICIFFNKS